MLESASSDANGNVIRRYDYEPYGAVVGGQVADGPGYTGHVSDSATGLSYMQQRYMDPQLGVFLSVDPVTAYANPVGMFNRYRYASGTLTDIRILMAGVIHLSASSGEELDARSVMLPTAPAGMLALACTAL